ncbi:MAG: restriction endonuclease [Olsenella sp.]|nr:restriction endonuclease [Olsenella sp.]
MDSKFVNLKTVSDLSLLTGLAFEEYLEQLFTDLGYSVERTPASGDFGADLILAGGGESVAVQAKQYSGTVGFDAVKEVVFARQYYGTKDAWVVTTSSFTAQATEAAKKSGVRLIEGRELEGLIKRAKSGDAIRAGGVRVLSVPTVTYVVGERAGSDGFCNASAIVSSFDGIASPEDVRALLDRCWHEGKLRKRAIASGASYALPWAEEAWRAVRESKAAELEDRRRRGFARSVNLEIAGKRREEAAHLAGLQRTQEEQRSYRRQIDAERGRLASLQKTLDERVGAAESISDELSKAGVFAFGRRRELKARFGEAQGLVDETRGEIADSEGRIAIEEEKLAKSVSKGECQSADLDLVRGEIAALEALLRKGPGPLGDDDVAERIRAVMEVWGCPVTASWCTQNVPRVESEDAAAKALKGMARSLDALEVGEGKYVLTGPPSFERDMEVLANQGAWKWPHSLDRKRERYRCLSEIYRRMPDGGEWVTNDWLWSHCRDIHNISALMHEAVNTGYFEKEVEKVGARTTVRYRKLDRRKSPYDRSAVASEARKKNEELARKVYGRMPYAARGITIQEIASMGIPEITTPQKAAAVMRVGIELGLFVKLEERVGDGVVYRYRKKTEF